MEGVGVGRHAATHISVALSQNTRAHCGCTVLSALCGDWPVRRGRAVGRAQRALFDFGYCCVGALAQPSAFTWIDTVSSSSLIWLNALLAQWLLSASNRRCGF